MFASVLTCLNRGLEGRIVEVQADVSPGPTKFNLVGLADVGVKEARERVRSAIRNSLLPFPQLRLTVNLAPVELRKEGGGFDLPVAVAISLALSGRRPPEGSAFIGELALDGSVRHADGVLVGARALRFHGVETLFVSPADAAEAALAPGLAVVPAPDLASLMRHLAGEAVLPVHAGEVPAPPGPPGSPVDGEDLAEVHGQEAARRALELAAAGGHHLLLSGSPGAGKTMLARCLPGILPPLTLDEAVDVAQVGSILGELADRPLRWERPFRAPRHSISTAGLVGGGSGLGRPGEVSRADSWVT